MNTFWTWVEMIFGGDKYAPATVTIDHTMPTPPAIPPANLLDTFCGYIKLREGANPANNNPGNAKYFYGGYLPVYEPVKRSPGGFAMFPTYEIGWLYLENLVKSIIREHPAFTFYDFFNLYAPKNDGNDPKDYAEKCALACGLPVNSKVAQILG